MGFGIGDKVNWTYKHWLNSKSFTYITKTGELLEFIGERRNQRYVSGVYAKVHFEGNKHPSKVLVSELSRA